MTARIAITETTEELVKRFIEDARQPNQVGAVQETHDRLVTRLRQEGVLDERTIQYVIRSLRPGGEQRILPDETREEAVARLRRHFGWDERIAKFTLSLSEGWSDLVPVDDGGTELPFFRCREAFE